jgi:hypothetical protein
MLVISDAMVLVRPSVAPRKRPMRSVGQDSLATGEWLRIATANTSASCRKRHDELMPDLEDELPWPQAGDRLFAEAPDWWMNATVNWGGSLIYAVGYRAAADALVEKVAETHTEQDSLVYPIVFCYRQYLELILKDVLITARRYFEVRKPAPEKEPLNKHALGPLWDELCPLLERRWPEGGGDHANVKSVIAQLDAVDRMSFAFRYPTTKKGEQSLPRDMQRINLRNLADVVARIGTFLEATNDMLDAEEQAADYESEFDWGV